MKDLFQLKTWAGALTIGSFVVMAVTGVMLFFHVNVGLSKLAHEWLGWVLIVGGLAHVVVNWKAFLAYFRKPASVAIVAILCVAMGAAFLAPGRPPRHRTAFNPSAFEQAPLHLMAQVAKCTPEKAVERLKEKGIQVENLEQTIAEIASANSRLGMEVLAIILGQSSGGHH
ncbi:MAG: DUF4405 domain-containing protein [Pirellulales bacterium]|nr:DUF4405 domain-containing protein [Pirellulales bacterium]